jgi:hypothetical protein
MMPVLPPIEYDKPYTGELTLKRVATQEDVRASCPTGPEEGE